MIDVQLNNEIVALRKKIRENILDLANTSSKREFVVYIESILMKPYTCKFNIWSALHLFDVDMDYETSSDLEELLDVYFGLVQSEGV
jgi:hypothetical protein